MIKSEYLMRNIVSYGSIAEVIVLMQTNRRFFKIFSEFFQIFERECLRLFSSDLELFKYSPFLVNLSFCAETS